ncbi:FixH family protein [Virgibacillus sp. 179-BFC.A HS]|uniref:FixH family protein n=1 Tax=Tigheibacillus jepli TaxID=3035914 RepID=A0ABU5CF25_9BACI|nr:FixH family protein [Virgibacillus sp. 179-BFC.A HS]MDY0404929.1 FixH family protein [Virgibacillus sp. 179-BFC.A HS]
MAKKLGIVAVILVFGLLAACGNSEKNNDDATDEIKELHADLHVPEHTGKGEKVTFKTDVTYGDEKVKAADEVKYQIWVDGDKDSTSEMIDAKNNKDGSYSIEKTFDKDAVYSVQVHVTAKDQHTMPLKQIAIGNAKAENAKGGHESHEHEHVKGFSMHFKQPEKWTAGEKSTMKVHVQLNDKPLKDANVRFEIWKNESDKHEFIDAVQKDNVYTADHTFDSKGKYQIKIHVENDKLHEHEVHEIEVE